MPRRKRLWRSNVCHHVMLRGIAARAIFNDDQDRVRFLLMLQEASEMCLLKIHAFCLMSNHVHLMLEPTTLPLADGVHRLAGRYARYFNNRNLKQGYVFQDRFRSIIVQDGMYVRRLARYIHLNPIEAYLVTHPRDYQWSSFNAYLGNAQYTWLSMDRVLSHFGKNRAKAIEEMVLQTELKMDVSADAEEIRRAFQVGAFGDEEFVKACGGEIDLESPRAFRHEDTASCSIDSLVHMICEKFDVTIHELQGSEKRRQLVQARGVLARAAQLKPGLDLRMVCKVLQKCHGTVSRLAAAVRKNQELEEIVQRLIETN